MASYKAHAERARVRGRLDTLAAQDIAPCPTPKKLDRRSAADVSFRAFCESYFPAIFTLIWSDDHLRVIAKIERAVLNNETFCIAMPRGSGKTALCRTGVLWSVLIGRHPFVVLVAADNEEAARGIDHIRWQLMNNDLLAEDYPEACYPFRRLENEARRCLGQRYYGRLTGIRIASDRLIFAALPGSRCAGSMIYATGLTGNIRGLAHPRPDGAMQRPTLAIIDDPQTDESARSPAQVENRWRLLNGAIAGLAGPGRRIAMMMPCTVIREDDLADRTLKTPQWGGERTKMVYTWPTNESLWKQYADLRINALRETGGDRSRVAKICNEFYGSHRVDMDAGAVVAWPANYEQDELSAIQYAWNKRIDLPEHTFFSEYQNDPLPDVADTSPLTADDICRRLSNHKRLVVPIECQTITAFIDVQDKLLYYAVVAWAAGFTGFVVDYGSEPDQKDPYFNLRDVKRTLVRAVPGAGVEGAIHAGLERLTTALVARDWIRTDGTPMRLDKLLIDANDNTDVVKKFCRQSPNHGVLMPSHGRYVGAASVPMSEYRPKPGERVGDNWRVPTLAQRAYTRHVLFDANYWKTFIARRLQTAIGDRGALTLFGESPERHRMLADHMTAEFPVRVVGRGRSIDEWKARPGRDNHLLDCVVGAAVAASMAGVTLETDRPRPPRKVVRFADAKRNRI